LIPPSGALTQWLANTRRRLNTKKFADFIKMCEQAKADGVEVVVVAAPWVIGDTYEEIIESLSRLADAQLALSVMGR
jgi:dihydrodipicolinate synthase/N-acetylneuraminate lyase